MSFIFCIRDVRTDLYYREGSGFTAERPELAEIFIVPDILMSEAVASKLSYLYGGVMVAVEPFRDFRFT